MYKRTYGADHNAIDIAGGSNSDILAIGSGKVIAAGWESLNGNVVRIDHGNGIVSRYSHLSSISVSVGATVSKGQTIGIMGNTGGTPSGGTIAKHLHFQILKNGSFVNPRGYINFPPGGMGNQSKPL